MALVSNHEVKIKEDIKLDCLKRVHKRKNAKISADSNRKAEGGGVGLSITHKGKRFRLNVRYNSPP